MPARSDDPLRRVTLNLYEADCKRMEAIHGQGWTTIIRQIVHNFITEANKATGLTLGDLE